jgi:hypothetical protein
MITRFALVLGVLFVTLYGSLVALAQYRQLGPLPPDEAVRDQHYLPGRVRSLSAVDGASSAGSRRMISPSSAIWRPASRPLARNLAMLTQLLLYNRYGSLANFNTVLASVTRMDVDALDRDVSSWLRSLPRCTGSDPDGAYTVELSIVPGGYHIEGTITFTREFPRGLRLCA